MNCTSEILAINGNKSLLFKDLLSHFNQDEKKALEYYLDLSSSFKQNELGNFELLQKLKFNKELSNSQKDAFKKKFRNDINLLELSLEGLNLDENYEPHINSLFPTILNSSNIPNLVVCCVNNENDFNNWINNNYSGEVILDLEQLKKDSNLNDVEALSILNRKLYYNLLKGNSVVLKANPYHQAILDLLKSKKISSNQSGVVFNGIKEPLNIPFIDYRNHLIQNSKTVIELSDSTKIITDLLINKYSLEGQKQDIKNNINVLPYILRLLDESILLTNPEYISYRSSVINDLIQYYSQSEIFTKDGTQYLKIIGTDKIFEFDVFKPTKILSRTSPIEELLEKLPQNKKKPATTLSQLSNYSKEIISKLKKLKSIRIIKGEFKTLKNSYAQALKDIANINKEYSTLLDTAPITFTKPFNGISTLIINAEQKKPENLLQFLIKLNPLTAEKEYRNQVNLLGQNLAEIHFQLSQQGQVSVAC